WRPTKLVIARTPSLLALAGALSLARALFVTAAVSWSVLGWGMRYLGMMVLGLVILISAMRVSIRALRVWSVPELMISAMCSATSARVAVSGTVGSASSAAASSLRRACSCLLVGRSSARRWPAG